jgi:hypothetical protein
MKKTQSFFFSVILIFFFFFFFNFGFFFFYTLGICIQKYLLMLLGRAFWFLFETMF